MLGLKIAQQDSEHKLTPDIIQRFERLILNFIAVAFYTRGARPCCSTGFDDRITAGYGKCDNYGFFDIPLPDFPPFITQAPKFKKGQKVKILRYEHLTGIVLKQNESEVLVKLSRPHPKHNEIEVCFSAYGLEPCEFEIDQRIKVIGHKLTGIVLEQYTGEVLVELSRPHPKTQELRVWFSTERVKPLL